MKGFLVYAFTIIITAQAYSQDTTVVTKPAPVPAPTAAPKPVSSESDMDNKFNFGLSVTPSITWFNVSSDYAQSDGSKFGFSYGLVGEYSFAQRYAFSTGIDIAYRGGKLKNNTGDTLSDWKTNYVGLPLSLKMRTNQIGRFAYFGQFGVVMEFNTGAKTEYDYSNGTSEKKSAQKSWITDFDMTFRVGAGTEYYLNGSTRMFGGITWNQGLTDVFSSDEVDAKNSYVAFQIGVFF